jgi:hypothetical protein
MPILRIHYAVPNFDGWKRAFDSDPIERKAFGVRRYHVHRSIADPNFVMIDLEFDSVVADAERLLEKLRLLWAGLVGPLCGTPKPGSSKLLNQRRCDKVGRPPKLPWNDGKKG